MPRTGKLCVAGVSRGLSRLNRLGPGQVARVVADERVSEVPDPIAKPRVCCRVIVKARLRAQTWCRGDGSSEGGITISLTTSSYFRFRRDMMNDAAMMTKTTNTIATGGEIGMPVAGVPDARVVMTLVTRCAISVR